MKIIITYLLVLSTVFQTVHAQTAPPGVGAAGDQICVACEQCAEAGDACVTDVITDISCLPNVCELLGGEELCLACELCQGPTIPDCDLADVLELSCRLCGLDVAGAVVDIVNGVGNGVQQVAASGACFSELATVLVEDGSFVQMKDLQVGDRILSDPTTGTFEQVYSFGHWHPTKEAEFLQIHHVHQDYQQPLEVTRDHLIYVQGQPAPVPAHTVKVGDSLQVSVSSTNSTNSAVTQITPVQRRGIYAPLTASGTLVVDGVAASSYIQINNNNQQKQQQLPFVSDHALIHATLAPFRMVCDNPKSLFGLNNLLCDKYHSTSGMPYYVHYGWHLLQFLSHTSNKVVAALGWSLVLVVTGVFQLIEGLPLFLVCLVGGVAIYATKKTTKK